MYNKILFSIGFLVSFLAFLVMPMQIHATETEETTQEYIINGLNDVFIDNMSTWIYDTQPSVSYNNLVGDSNYFILYGEGVGYILSILDSDLPTIHYDIYESEGKGVMWLNYSTTYNYALLEGSNTWTLMSDGYTNYSVMLSYNLDGEFRYGNLEGVNPSFVNSSFELSILDSDNNDVLIMYPREVYGEVRETFLTVGYLSYDNWVMYEEGSEIGYNYVLDNSLDRYGSISSFVPSVGDIDQNNSNIRLQFVSYMTDVLVENYYYDFSYIVEFNARDENDINYHLLFSNYTHAYSPFGNITTDRVYINSDGNLVFDFRLYVNSAGADSPYSFIWVDLPIESFYGSIPNDVSYYGLELSLGISNTKSSIHEIPSIGMGDYSNVTDLNNEYIGLFGSILHNIYELPYFTFLCVFALCCGACGLFLYGRK